MPKRIAGNQMTQDNWDEEDDKDDEGGQIGIPKATNEAMKGRVIKVAKRKGIAGASDTDGGNRAFAGFGGFGALKTSSTTTFSGFGTQISKSDSSQTNGTKDPSSGGAANKKSDEYYAKLRALNESVSAWIKQHVDKNPYCILTPVFKDYAQHLESVEKLNTEKGGDGAVKSSSLMSVTSTGSSDGKTTENRHVKFDLKADKSDTTTKPTFSFGLSSSSSAETPKTCATTTTSTVGTGLFSFTPKTETSSSDSKILTPKFSFGLTAKPADETAKSTAAAATAPAFSFGTTSSGGAATGGFSFSASSKPFSFASGATTPASGGTTATQATGGGEEEEYVPPKPEVVEAKEEGATYSKRCKLFWMVDGAWKERGLGNLHLKPLDSGKTQLVMRADTSLGNVILNILLNDSVPVSRSGKNMVNLICIPDPPFNPKSEPKPEKLLLKVKTSEDADELFTKLEEAKK